MPLRPASRSPDGLVPGRYIQITLEEVLHLVQAGTLEPTSSKPWDQIQLGYRERTIVNTPLPRHLEVGLLT